MRKLVLTLLLFIVLPVCVGAQEGEVHVSPVGKTHRTPIRFDIFLHTSGAIRWQSNFWTASNNNIYDSQDPSNSVLRLGVEGNLYKWPIVQLGLCAGYAYDRFAYDKGFSPRSGVLSHWAYTEFNVRAYFVCAGLGADYLLGSRTASNEAHRYMGLNNDCFNRVALRWYIGLFFNISRVRLDVRMVDGLTPHINPDKVAYYNMGKTYIHEMALEVGLSYRIFTSGRKQNFYTPFDMFDEISQ